MNTNVGCWFIESVQYVLWFSIHSDLYTKHNEYYPRFKSYIKKLLYVTLKLYSKVRISSVTISFYLTIKVVHTVLEYFIVCGLKLYEITLCTYINLHKYRINYRMFYIYLPIKYTYVRALPNSILIIRIMTTIYTSFNRNISYTFIYLYI